MEVFKAHDTICFVEGRFFSPLSFFFSPPLFVRWWWYHPSLLKVLHYPFVFLADFFRKDLHRFNKMLKVMNSEFFF